MRAAEPLSLLSSGAAERAFANEAFVRRLAKTAKLEAGARVLQLGLGDGSLGLLLAEKLGCHVLVVHPEGQAMEQLQRSAEPLSLGDRLELRPGDPSQWKGSGDFRMVVVAGVLAWGFVEAARRLRDELGQDGRLCRLYPVQVGLATAAPAWREAWETRLAEPLATPGALLLGLEEAGFEPEGLETLSNSELDAVLQAQPPTEAELPLYTATQGLPRASCAAVLARRREPGEKPPVSGDRG